MTGMSGTERRDVADTIIGLTVGFLFCVLCMCALGLLLGD